MQSLLTDLLANDAAIWSNPDDYRSPFSVRKSAKSLHRLAHFPRGPFQFECFRLSSRDNFFQIDFVFFLHFFSSPEVKRTIFG